MSLPHHREMPHQFLPPLASLSVRAGNDPGMPLPPLLGQILLSWAGMLPCTEVAANDKFQWKIMFAASQCFVVQNIFCWAILYLVLPHGCPALQSSGSAEGNIGWHEFSPLFQLQPWPAGISMDSHSCTFLSSHAAVKKTSTCEFFSGVSCKEMKTRSLEGVPRVYTGVLCCLRVSS